MYIYGVCDGFDYELNSSAVLVDILYTYSKCNFIWCAQVLMSNIRANSR